MATSTPEFVLQFERAARRAKADEDACRSSASADLEKYARRRRLACRRLQVVKALAAAATSAQTRESAVAAEWEAFCELLGWTSETIERKKVRGVLAALFEAIWLSHARAQLPADEAHEMPDVSACLDAFEAWYEIEHRTNVLWQILPRAHAGAGGTE